MEARRGKKFTGEEKMFLLELVDLQKSILLCRKSDQVSNKQKTDAWKKIEHDFNSRFPDNPRKATSLKLLYDNLKRKTRQTVAETNRSLYVKHLKTVAKKDKREINKTGGGSYKPQLTDAEGRVLAMLGDSVKPLENPYDSAADYFSKYCYTGVSP
ncbi:unnamed protein product [Callosobruchus maculatus]|uniref:Regulatory protein zeste n=1 Tax=Callosobruchus maculatus TaxID=64391 RepID=A0A653DUL6_CALMS|nr:unnamed protein product [Callosobruchus maculatus]